MNLKINGITIDKYSNVNVSLIYDSVCSIFSFDIYWDTNNKDMRAVMLPGAYNQCTVSTDDDEVLITGVLLSPSFKSSAVKSLVNISGYSRTGVLGDCEYSAVFPGTQSNGLTLFKLCENICQVFGLTLAPIPSNVKDIPITQTDTDRDKTILAYLSDVAKDSNIVISHTADGSLLITLPQDTDPIYNFTHGQPGFMLELSFNGQAMHNVITAEAQSGSTQSIDILNPYVQQRIGFNKLFKNTTQTDYSQKFTESGVKVTITPTSELINNAYSTGFRPHSVQQTNSDSTKLQDVANQALADDLKGVSLRISMIGWTLNKVIPRPGQYITVQNPELYLFKPAKFIIESVSFSGDATQETAVLNCVLPEVYNDDIEKGEVPINIFKAAQQDQVYTSPNTDDGTNNNKNRSRFPTGEFNPDL